MIHKISVSLFKINLEKDIFEIDSKIETLGKANPVYIIWNNGNFLNSDGLVVKFIQENFKAYTNEVIEKLFLNNLLDKKDISDGNSKD